jgi:hypothetical protein
MSLKLLKRNKLKKLNEQPPTNWLDLFIQYCCCCCPGSGTGINSGELVLNTAPAFYQDVIDSATGVNPGELIPNPPSAFYEDVFETANVRSSDQRERAQYLQDVTRNSNHPRFAGTTPASRENVRRGQFQMFQ